MSRHIARGRPKQMPRHSTVLQLYRQASLRPSYTKCLRSQERTCPSYAMHIPPLCRVVKFIQAGQTERAAGQILALDTTDGESQAQCTCCPTCRRRYSGHATNGHREVKPRIPLSPTFAPGDYGTMMLMAFAARRWLGTSHAKLHPLPWRLPWSQLWGRTRYRTALRRVSAVYVIAQDPGVVSR
ncbi:uncharacterized protein B0I36DRAFT_62872 [Microdochium trichocladiopsis]|uniref:Uncharacterized protein n=1 Tax=Microdochium trichocladiopsis TaxID=1682393 RepID=A0A9P8YD06_9PEZI|nr:uncharacterized protein B0I36DRAFT_62872 [Microdochium trichocladiopsis]KAH7037205.1 hypothetical protein B0I36DRAFT_62872 [Microdochium trichocladiopsis]